MRKRRSLLFVFLLIVAAWFSSPTWLSWLGHSLIAQDQPFKADAIAVLAGDSLGERIGRAVELAREQWAPIILVSSSGKVFDSVEGELAINWAVKQGAPREWFVLVAHQADSTVEECIVLESECRKRGIRKLLLVTSEFHTRRASRILQRVAPQLSFRTVGSRTAVYDPDSWWKNRPSRKIWLLEASKTVADFLGM